LLFFHFFHHFFFTVAFHGFFAIIVFSTIHLLHRLKLGHLLLVQILRHASVLLINKHVLLVGLHLHKELLVLLLVELIHVLFTIITFFFSFALHFFLIIIVSFLHLLVAHHLLHLLVGLLDVVGVIVALWRSSLVLMVHLHLHLVIVVFELLIDFFAFKFLAELIIDDLLLTLSVDVNLVIIALFFHFLAFVTFIHVHVGLELSNDFRLVTLNVLLLTFLLLAIVNFLTLIAFLFFTLVLFALVFTFFVLLLHSHGLVHLLLGHALDALVVLFLLILLLIDWHAHLLSLKKHKLLLLVLIKDVHAAIFVSSWRNSTWEVSKLVKLIEVLGSLKQDLLVLSKMIIWVKVGISENCDVLLEVSDLVIEVDELLGLLLNQKRAVSNIKLHDSLLLIVDIFQVFHLVLGTLKAVVPLLFELKGIVGESWRLLHSVGETNLLDCSHVLLSNFLLLGTELYVLGLSSHGDHSFVFLGGGRVDLLLKIGVDTSRGGSGLLSGVNDLVFFVHVLAEVGFVFILVKVKWLRHSLFEGALVLGELLSKFLVESLEVGNFSDGLFLYLATSTGRSLGMSFFLLSLLLVGLHPWRKLAKAETYLSIFLNTLVAVVVLVNDSLVKRHKNSPWDLARSEWSILAHIIRELSLFTLFALVLDISFVKVEGLLSSLNFGHSKPLGILSLFLVALTELLVPVLLNT